MSLHVTAERRWHELRSVGCQDRWAHDIVGFQVLGYPCYGVCLGYHMLSQLCEGSLTSTYVFNHAVLDYAFSWKAKGSSFNLELDVYFLSQYPRKIPHRITVHASHLIISIHGIWQLQSPRELHQFQKLKTNLFPALLHTHNIPRQQPHTKDWKSAICTGTAHAQIGFTYYTPFHHWPPAPFGNTFSAIARCIMATPSTHMGRRWKRPGARTGLVVLWLLTSAAAHLGTCGDVGYVGASWGRPRPTRIPMQVRERRSEKRAPSKERKTARQTMLKRRS